MIGIPVSTFFTGRRGGRGPATGFFAVSGAQAATWVLAATAAGIRMMFLFNDISVIHCPLASGQQTLLSHFTERKVRSPEEAHDPAPCAV